jgi:hypothetical protein
MEQSLRRAGTLLQVAVRSGRSRISLSFAAERPARGGGGHYRRHLLRRAWWRLAWEDVEILEPGETRAEEGNDLLSFHDAVGMATAPEQTSDQPVNRELPVSLSLISFGSKLERCGVLQWPVTVGADGLPGGWRSMAYL